MDQSPILAEEARFADAHYTPYADDLSMNQRLYGMYANPSHKWSIRERGAMLLSDIRGKHLLDFGSGMGEEAVYFAKLGATVTAIDISEVGVEITRRRALANNCRLSANVMDVTNTSFPSEAFDVIHGYGILHHVGLERGLAEVRRLLRPGGRAVFFEHMENSGLIRLVKERLGKGDYTSHEQPVTWKECQHVCRKYFKHVELYPYYLLGRLRRRYPVLASELIQRIDYYSMTTLPFLGRYAGSVVLFLES